MISLHDKIRFLAWKEAWERVNYHTIPHIRLMAYNHFNDIVLRQVHIEVSDRIYRILQNETKDS